MRTAGRRSRVTRPRVESLEGKALLSAGAGFTTGLAGLGAQVGPRPDTGDLAGQKGHPVTKGQADGKERFASKDRSDMLDRSREMIEAKRDLSLQGSRLGTDKIAR